jgi:hypothetical protein
MYSMQVISLARTTQYGSDCLVGRAEFLGVQRREVRISRVMIRRRGRWVRLPFGVITIVECLRRCKGTHRERREQVSLLDNSSSRIRQEVESTEQIRLDALLE